MYGVAALGTAALAFLVVGPPAVWGWAGVQGEIAGWLAAIVAGAVYCAARVVRSESKARQPRAAEWPYNPSAFATHHARDRLFERHSIEATEAEWADAVLQMTERRAMLLDWYVRKDPRTELWRVQVRGVPPVRSTFFGSRTSRS